MNRRNAKDEIKELMKNYKNSQKEDDKETLVKFLQACSDESNNVNLINNNKNQSASKYKFCGATNSRYCGYFINQNGEMKIVEIKSDSKKNFWNISKGTEENEILNICNTSEPLELINGYIHTELYNNEETRRNIALAINYDIYKFMEEAGWLDDKEEDEIKNKEIADDIVNLSNFQHDRLEIHHINNNPNDNRVENLVYLPRSIHAFAHKYKIDEKSYNLKLTEDEYKKVNAFITYVLRG